MFALCKKELADKLNLKLKPVRDFILQEFDSRITELTKRGLIYHPQQFTPDDSKKEFIVLNKPPHPRLTIRSIEFNNGAGIGIYLAQAQVHSGKLIGEPVFWIAETIDGASLEPLDFRFMSKVLTLKPEKTMKVTTTSQRPTIR